MLEKVICSKDHKAVLIKGLYGLCTKRFNQTEKDVNIGIPVKVLRLLPWKNPSIIILQIPGKRSQ